MTKHTRNEGLQQLVNSKIKVSGFNPIHNFVLWVREAGSDSAFSAQHNHGRIEIGTTIYNQFKTGSITKMLLAVLILQMEEDGIIAIDDPVSTYLPEIGNHKIDKMHIFQDNLRGGGILIKDLLSHRSGIADIFQDGRFNFYCFLLFNSKQKWSPIDIVDWFCEKKINHRSHFLPGEGYYYSDMNYVILGLIIERISGCSLAQQLRSRIFNPLKMFASGLQYHEQFDDTNVSPTFFSRWNVTNKINTSYDWGGGGVVSNAPDLLNFICSTFDDTLFRSAISTQKMMNAIPITTKENPFAYGLGVYQFRVFDEVFYGHDGFWGSYLLHNPSRKISLCFTTNQAAYTFNIRQFVKEVILLISA